MNELIKVTTNENDEQLVSARDLYKYLGIKKRFSLWWKQYSDMFIEDQDFTSVPQGTVVESGNGTIRRYDDFAIKVDIAKHISMLTKTKKGEIARNYFIKVEKLWNSPEMVTKRALEFQQKKILTLEQQIENDKPKTLFAEAVQGSVNNILIKDLAVLLKQNGIEIGQNRLFKYLRKNKFLGNGKGHYNKPSQRSMDMGLFEYREHFHTNGLGKVETKFTPMVTGKGQQYFINKFLNQQTEVIY